MAFGSGNALAKARFGPVMFSMVIVFFLLIYVQIKSDSWSIWAVVVFILGIVHANRDGSAFLLIEDIFYSIRNGLKNIFQRMPSKTASASPETASSKHSGNAETSDHAWEAEQSRREQEARSERSRQKQQADDASEKEQTTQEAPKRKSKTSNQQQTKSEQEKIEKPPPNDRRSSLEVLGLSSGFSQEELKRAYKRESARCHPDKWMGKPEHLRLAMEEEQRLINRAYAALKE